MADAWQSAAAPDDYSVHRTFSASAPLDIRPSYLERRLMSERIVLVLPSPILVEGTTSEPQARKLRMDSPS